MGVNRPGVGITSHTKIIANIFVSFIGAGMLGLPFAFKESGIMEGALIMAMVGYLSVTAMLMLIDCKYAILSSGGRAGGRSITMDTKVPLIPPDSSDDEDEDERHPPTPSTDLTYGDVGLYAYGPGGKRLVDIAIVISQIGFCCGYLIYLCKNLSVYIPQISQQVWLILLIPPLYLLTLLRHLNKLAVFSLFAQVSNVFALAVVFWFDFSHSEKVPFRPKEFSLMGFPFFFAVSIYCYEGAGMILSLEESVAENKREKFRPIFICTMAGLTTLYICFGVSGYASFGRHTKDIITLNLPHGNSSVDFAAMVKICLGVSLFFTYPMMMFPVTHLLDKTFGFTAFPYRGNIMRLILVIITGLVVSAVSNFAVLMSIIGATCCTLLAFILPAAFHMSIFKHRLTKRQWYFDAMLIFLGVTGAIIGVWDAFNRMGSHDKPVEVNEFSPMIMKNGSLHSNNGLGIAKTTPSMEKLYTAVHTALVQTGIKYIVQPTKALVINQTTLPDKVTSTETAHSVLLNDSRRVVAAPTKENIVDGSTKATPDNVKVIASAGGKVATAVASSSQSSFSEASDDPNTFSFNDDTNDGIQMLKSHSTTATKIITDPTLNKGKTKTSSVTVDGKTKTSSVTVDGKTKTSSVTVDEKTVT